LGEASFFTTRDEATGRIDDHVPSVVAKPTQDHVSLRETDPTA
jgi:hypothetical protein